jgi:DNA-binding CsgD family transcriptional regulator
MSVSTAILNLLPTPILVVDAAGNCIHTNAAADRLLAATRMIRIRNGVLLFADQDVLRQIAGAIRAAALGAEAPSMPTALVGLTLERKRHYAVQAIAIDVDGQRPDGGVAALLLQEIGTLQPLPGDILVKFYGLTRAEARLLALLAQDLSLDDAASALGIARTTAKTHLQRVFEKTGTKRQPQVVRLALSAISASHTR